MGPSLGTIIAMALATYIIMYGLAGFLFAASVRLAEAAGAPLTASEGLQGLAIKRGALAGLIVALVYVAALFSDSLLHTRLSLIFPRAGIVALLIAFVPLALKCFEQGSPISNPVKVAASVILALTPVFIFAAIGYSVGRH